ncbi:hypothetical protein BOX15_Mlig010681g1, partial [Macrostomum lignano]
MRNFCVVRFSAGYKFDVPQLRFGQIQFQSVLCKQLLHLEVHDSFACLRTGS